MAKEFRRRDKFPLPIQLVTHSVKYYIGNLMKQLFVMSFFFYLSGCGVEEIKSCAEIALAAEITSSKGACEQEGYILNIDGSYFVTNSPDYDAAEYLVGLGGIEDEQLQFMRDNQGKRVYVFGPYVKVTADHVTMENMEVFRRIE